MEFNESFQTEFDKNFNQYKNVPITIYGTGKNAELLVKYVRGYHFSALVSPDLAGKTMYGKRIITIEEAVKNAKVLIIAAIPSSTGIVYARIKDIIPQDSGLLVYDMRGQRLNEGEFYTKNPYWEKRADELYRRVDRHDIISFDIFDTLVMRRVLRPADIFLIIQKKLEKEKENIPFLEWRVNSEKEAEKNGCPGFNQIYKVMERLYGVDGITLGKLKKLELDTELEFICGRQAMKELLLYACRNGKTVYLTTDMYFPRKILEKLLAVCGIVCDCEMLISCECEASKRDGRLYDVLKRKGCGKAILHIGDNYETDVVHAQSQGIDSCWIMSGYDMFAASSAAYLADTVSGIGEKIMLGTFIADLLNDPFALNESRGKIRLDSYRALAYAAAPVTALFMKFIIEKSRHYDCILFPSRDGYFLRGLFQDIKQRKHLQDIPDGIYIYASRSAVNRAAVRDENDIVTVCSKLMEDPRLNIKEFLKMQFFIDAGEELDITAGEARERWGDNGLWEKILIHKKEMTGKAEEERKRYVRYLRKIGVGRYRRPAVVDIVTQGTLIYGLSKITGISMDLIALGTSAVPNRYISDWSRVKSVYGNVNGKADGVPYSFSDFSELHLFLEMLYSSCEGQFAGFGEDGSVETFDNEYDSGLLKGVQCEIASILQMLPDCVEIDISPRFASAFLRIFYSRNADMPDCMKERFLFSDPYDADKVECNLMDCIG